MVDDLTKAKNWLEAHGMTDEHSIDLAMLLSEQRLDGFRILRRAALEKGKPALAATILRCIEALKKLGAYTVPETGK